MSDPRVLQYRISRLLGRILTRAAAVLTLGRIPPFVSSSAIVVDGNRILVIIDPIRNEPVLPGGHLKWAEKPEAAVVREVKEETGYRIMLDSLIGVFSGHEWSGEAGVVRVIYSAQTVGGILTSSAEGDAMWMDIDHYLDSDTRDTPIVRMWMNDRK